MNRLNINAELAARILTGFIRDSITKAGMSRAVIGLSGGIDSALSAYLCARALGAENVLALRMPYKTSSPESLKDAELVIEDLGLPHLSVPITELVDPLIQLFPDMSNLRRGNIMARTRMIVLYDQSMAWGGLVMGTSNKTEFLLGYSTIYGDSGVALHPIADLYKYQVRQLARHLGVPLPFLTSRPPPISGSARPMKTNSASPMMLPIKSSSYWSTSATPLPRWPRKASIVISSSAFGNASKPITTSAPCPMSPRSASAASGTTSSICATTPAAPAASDCLTCR